MDNAIYVTLSKQLAQFRQMDAIASNIANANTTAYKPETVLFHDYIVTDADDKKIAYTQDVGSYRDHSVGTLKTTGNPLDLALSDNAYFVVQTTQGERYTRAGNFQLDGNKTLVNADGYPVLDAGGQPIVFQQEDRNIRIAEDGMIIVDGEERGQLNIVSFENEQFLKEEGGTLYNADAAQPKPAIGFKVSQGMLEESGVEPVMEMTNMITTLRRVGSTSQFIETAYELQRQAIETYGKQN